MAIIINVPSDFAAGGQITVDNAAQEDTLQQLLAEFRKTKALEVKNTDKLSKGMGEAEQSTSRMRKAVDVLAEDTLASSKKATQLAVSLAILKGNMRDFGRDLVATSTNIASNMLSKFEDIAKSPIQFAANLVETGIDAIEAFAGGLLEAIPVIGGFARAFTKGVADASKFLNDVFSQQLQKSVDGIQSFTREGISFAMGLTEMRIVANQAGIGLDQFTQVVKNARQDLRLLGVSGGEAASRLSAGLSGLATTIGVSGNSLRMELFKMGLGFEEQGEVMASYMANQKALGRLETMTNQQLAEGTREYAKNLKVLSDLTGEDARKLMERARAESMRGALMMRLDADQRKAFMEANSMLSKAGPEVQNALNQFLAFGTITDPAIAASAELRNLVTTVGNDVLAGNQNIISTTQTALVETAESMRSSGAGFSEAVDRVRLAGVGGLGATIADIQNKLLGLLLPGADPFAAEKALNTAEKQATTVDQMTDSVATMYDTAQKFARQMEEEVLKRLGNYAKILEVTLGGTINAMAGAVDLVLGGDANQIDPLLKSITKLTDEQNKLYGELKRINDAPVKSDSDATRLSQITARLEEINKERTNFAQEIKKLTGPEKYEFSVEPSFAKGGITSGPISGYQATLHGTEAVVPLPDGKSIPVTTQSSSEKTSAEHHLVEQVNSLKELVREVGLTNSMNAQNYGEMIKQLKNSNDINSRILNNSY